jgi:hypothetical protein
MDANQWLKIIVIGVSFGAAGQGARAIVGFKKVYDSTDADTPMSSLVDGMRLLMSFGIGAVAGLFAAVTLITDVAKIPTEQLFAIAAAGYSGADFIEGFVTRVSGGQNKKAAAPADAGTAAQGAGQQSIDDAVG